MAQNYFQPTLLQDFTPVAKISKSRSNKIPTRCASHVTKQDKKSSKKNLKKQTTSLQQRHADPFSSNIQVWTNNDFPLSGDDIIQPSAYVIKARAKSRNAFYASNSFSDEPTLSLFPQPPSHWTMTHQTSIGSSVCSSSEDDLSTTSSQSLSEITQALKLILNIGDQ